MRGQRERGEEIFMSIQFVLRMFRIIEVVLIEVRCQPMRSLQFSINSDGGGSTGGSSYGSLLTGF